MLAATFGKGSLSVSVYYKYTGANSCVNAEVAEIMLHGRCVAIFLRWLK